MPSTGPADVLWEVPLKSEWSRLARGTGVPVVEAASRYLVAVYALRRGLPYSLRCAREAVRNHNQPIKERNARAKKTAGRYVPAAGDDGAAARQVQTAGTG